MDQEELAEKTKFINEFQSFSNEIDKDLHSFLDSMKWDIYTKLGQNTTNYIICPFNEGHRVPEKSLEKHLENCEWKTLQYDSSDLPLPESFVPESSTSTIKIDYNLQSQILQQAKNYDPTLNIGSDDKLIPKTANRLMCDYTADERKAIYEFVIANTNKPDIGKDIDELGNAIKSKKSNEVSELELLIQERNLKRRRTKHRGVHTNKKSHTEILKEIIEQQMDMYREYIVETPKENIARYSQTEQKTELHFPNKYIEKSEKNHKEQMENNDNRSNRVKTNDGFEGKVNSEPKTDLREKRKLLSDTECEQLPERLKHSKKSKRDSSVGRKHKKSKKDHKHKHSKHKHRSRSREKSRSKHRSRSRRRSRSKNDG